MNKKKKYSIACHSPISRQHNIDGEFHRIPSRIQKAIKQTESTSKPACHIKEYNSYCELIVELPGVKDDDLIISTSKETIKLVGFQSKDEDSKFNLAYQLPFKFSNKKVEYKLENGILKLRLQKIKTENSNENNNFIFKSSLFDLLFNSKKSIQRPKAS